MKAEIGRSINVAGIATNYHDVGNGEPVLLLHGSGPGVSAWANWRLALSALAPQFRVIAPDMYGFGYTDFPKNAINDKKIWVDHIIGFMDALRVERVSIVGNSFGGAIALALLIAHPARFNRAVLMGAVGLDFEITPALDEIWGYVPSVEHMERVITLLASDPKRVTPELVQSRYAASIRTGAHEAYAATFGQAPRQRGISMLASKQDEIKRISHEILVLHGKDDKVIPRQVSERLAALLPRADLSIFANCGHWVQIERANAFHVAVASFLKNGLS